MRRRRALAVSDGEETVEENTSKVYVGADPLMNPTAPGAGSALFVINLCASIAPVQISGKNLPGLDNYRLYQVARVEDGRTRHRLRLGFFTSEAHAESVLAVVRQQYPTAFTACLCDEDRRFARGYLPDSAAPSTPAAAKRPVALVTNSAPAAQTSSPAPAKPPAPKTPVAATAKAAAPAAPKAQSVLQSGSKPADESTSATAKHPILSAVFKAQPVAKPAAPAAKAQPAPRASSDRSADAAASMRIKALDLTFSDPPAAPAHKPVAKSDQPFHVGKGVDIGDLKISLQADAPARTEISRATPSQPARTSGAAAANKSMAARSPTAATPASAQPAVKASSPMHRPPLNMQLPDLDSTQTIRALTSAELSEDAQEKWFAIQLAASEQPVNLDTMPRLDIFEAYRLYSVATAGSGKIIHSLRLGFFKEAVSAEAVSGYLKTFFGSPSVLRISVAEQARFKDAPAPKRSAAAETKNPGKIVELSDARAARPVIPTVTMEVPTPRADATGSFRMSDSGSFKRNATGSFKVNGSGSQKVLTPTLKPAAKSAGAATKRSDPIAHRSGATGKYKILPKKSLSEQLIDEAREVELSESGIRKLPKNNSLLSKLVDKLTK